MKYNSEQKEVEHKLKSFSEREEALLAKLGDRELPARLQDWRMWIGDSVIYLNDLRDFVEK